MASIRLERLHKKYGRIHAVRGIDLTIGDGEFVAFLGPSGCGKSSTMRMIAGLEEITSGTIYFDEKPVNRVRPRDRKVGMAFETYALYPTLNVYENLAFPLRAARRPADEIDGQVRSMAETLELTDLLERMPRSLSSGQAQRVGLARALVRKPTAFILDEPISHLDTRQRARMRAYLKRLHLELGYTMVYVTHDQEEAMAMADRIAVMREGQLVQVGTSEEIYGQPVDTFVAGFVGEPAMNFLACEYREEGGRRLLRARNGRPIEVPLPSQYGGLASTGAVPEGLILGIRPFYVDIAAARDADHAVPAEVFVVEPLGDMAIVTVEVGKERMQVVTDPAFRAPEGQVVWLALDARRTLLFDVSSGKALGGGRP